MKDANEAERTRYRTERNVPWRTPPRSASGPAEPLWYAERGRHPAFTDPQADRACASRRRRLFGVPASAGVRSPGFSRSCGTTFRCLRINALTAGTWLALMVLLAGCGGGITIPLPPSIFSPSVTTTAGNLTINQSADVTVSAVVTDASGTVTGVTADLTPIGGAQAVPLTLSTVPNTWSATVPVMPTVAGARQITITARSSTGLSSQATATINVTGTVDGNNLAPVVSPPAITGTLTATFSNTIQVSVVATDPDGTVQSVVADLSPIGGLATQPLLQSPTTPNLWTFTGALTPPTVGTVSVFVQAMDNQGATTTSSSAVVINSPVM